MIAYLYLCCNGRLLAALGRIDFPQQDDGDDQVCNRDQTQYSQQLPMNFAAGPFFAAAHSAGDPRHQIGEPVGEEDYNQQKNEKAAFHGTIFFSDPVLNETDCQRDQAACKYQKIGRKVQMFAFTAEAGESSRVRTL